MRYNCIGKLSSYVYAYQNRKFNKKIIWILATIYWWLLLWNINFFVSVNLFKCEVSEMLKGA